MTEDVDIIERLDHIASKVNMCEEFIANHPNPQDPERKPALENIRRYNKDLEKYYHKFSPEECKE